MGDVLDEVLGGENDEEESDQIVQSVLDEIGISVGQSVKDPLFLRWTTFTKSTGRCPRHPPPS